MTPAIRRTRYLMPRPLSQIDMIPFMLSNTTLTLVVAGVAMVATLTLLGGRRRSAKDPQLLPGPVPLPLIGNLLSIDPKKPWVTYTEWATRYGDIFRIRVLKQEIIVINSEKIARELLDRRSRIYSDRPYLASRVPYGLSFNFGFAPYGDRWRSQRRMFHQVFRAEAALAFHPIQLKKAHQLVLNMLNTPHDYYHHIQRFAAAVIMSIVYGYDITAGHDDLVELIERGNALAVESLTPETSSIIEAFPFLLSLPEWFPGAVIRRNATISTDCAIQMVEEPFEYARKRGAAGSGASTMALDLLRGIKDTDHSSQLQVVKDTCATAFVGGAETTTSTLRSFMLAMLQNPEVQDRAQAEIDAIIGRDRFPDFDDRPNLPYIEAILMETLRMYSILPLGIPHAVIADDVYEYFFIPKGCMVVANVWAMHHNEDVYPEPDIFKPERFLVNGKLRKDNVVDSPAFGFGRRICPGRYTADSSIWVAMVSILSAFKITKALDKYGEEIEVEATFTSGVTSVPNPFPCSITPRLRDMDIRKLLTTVDI